MGSTFYLFCFTWQGFEGCSWPPLRDTCQTNRQLLATCCFLAVVNTYYFGTQPVARPNYCKRQKCCQKGICPSDVIFGSSPQSCTFSHPLALAAFVTISWKKLFFFSWMITKMHWIRWQFKNCFEGMLTDSIASMSSQEICHKTYNVNDQNGDFKLRRRCQQIKTCFDGMFVKKNTIGDGGSTAL